MLSEKIINGKSLSQLEAEYPIIAVLRTLKETTWINPGKRPFQEAAETCPLTMTDIMDASDRLDRFADYFRAVFPETAATDGIIESPLVPIPAMQKNLEEEYACKIGGELWLKQDSHLPISGSIKARGGIYEVLHTAEKIALEHGLLTLDTPYRIFASDEFRRLFSQYSIAVGSTGNLGLSIGIMSAKLGFNVTVHMSADARQWKKDMLRSKGVTVVEYESDYSIAVANGRKQAEGDPYCHFIDDENSKTLFLGYSVAALRLKKQLETAHITVDAQHPLFVYLPCGVGGGPGGVAFGLKMVFGDAVHCFFAEPTQSCCMMLGMATGLNSGISVQDLGLTNLTCADGLAVGRASGFVGALMTPFISGCYSLSDERMYYMLAQLADSEGIYLEPSALAGMYGPILTERDPLFSQYIKQLSSSAFCVTHLVWATGGSMVPKEDMDHYYQTGKNICLPL
ncbi:MAG: D-serine ammonia-lyase [Ruminococcaceae bacterium]|nr:D-serine ammonia-lyase [Oscillospiraceae bacterium]